MPISSTDVPSVYDLVVTAGATTYGFIYANVVDESLPFRVQRAEYTFSPTFVDRQNVSNQSADNAFDFFLTARQRDWSLGEQQKYFRSGQDGRYWMGSNVDVTIPGQVSMRRAATSTSFGGTIITAAPLNAVSNTICAVSSTNLYDVDSTGAVTDRGAHGLGAAPSVAAAVSDGNAFFISTTTAGTVGVRRYGGGGGALSTFSATGADALAFLNNTLYGLRINSSFDLIQYDTAGTATSLYTWKDSAGTGVTATAARLEPYGGKLLILRQRGTRTGELWIYDGSGVSRIAEFPASFQAWDLEIQFGVAFISGHYVRKNGGSLEYKPAVFFFDGSTLGLLWSANSYSTTADYPAMVAFDDGLVFNDDTTPAIMFYKPSSGGVSAIGSYSVAGSNPVIAGTLSFYLHTRTGTTAYFAPDPSTTATSSYVISSLIDFDSSLSKQFRGVKVEWDAASDGNGGTVDIAYQVDSLTGSWTTLQTGATSGTEYTFSSVSGHAIAIKITLNKGTSTSGPTLKNLSVRAAPVLTSYRSVNCLIDASGRDGRTMVVQRNGVESLLDGQQIAANLKTIITSTSPVTLTDRFGTITAVPEPDKCSIIELRPEEYIVRAAFREV